jgi:hypothetical protein
MAEAELAVGLQAADDVLVIPPARRKNVLAHLGFTFLLLSFFSFCIEMVRRPSMNSPAPPLLLYLGLLLIWLLFAMLRELFSKEEVRIDHYVIEIERRLFGFSIGAEVFNTQDVSNVRVGRAGSWELKRKQEDGGILLDEGKNTFSFGAGLDEERARDFVAVINRRLSEQRRG